MDQPGPFVRLYMYLQGEVSAKEQRDHEAEMERVKSESALRQQGAGYY